jgi:nitrite reductase/ring-hydroxylating ferredoxin subunit
VNPTHESVTVDLTELTANGRLAIQAFGTTIALFDVGGAVFAVSNHCPHRGGPMCHGRISGAVLPSEPYDVVYGLEDRVVTCPWHRWQFQLETGEALFDPLMQIPTYDVEVNDCTVIIYDAPRQPVAR